MRPIVGSRDHVTTPGGLPSFAQPPRIAVIGASGGIGGALVSSLSAGVPSATILALSRNGTQPADTEVVTGIIDIEQEESIAGAAALAQDELGRLDLAIVATGLLHDGDAMTPEKSWWALDGASMERAFRINAIGPALVAKHFLPLLASDTKSVFASLSARVGSIEDNRLGGWYAYRASKAALNMMIKSLSIELERRNPKAICVGLHPGTVDTGLSKPFQSNVPEGKLFTPDHAAGALLSVIDGLGEKDTGRVFAWDGQPIPY